MVVSVAGGSPAEDAGMKIGMVVSQIGRLGVVDLPSYRAAMNQTAGATALFLVHSPKGSAFVLVKTPQLAQANKPPSS